MKYDDTSKKRHSCDVIKQDLTNRDDDKHSLLHTNVVTSVIVNKTIQSTINGNVKDINKNGENAITTKKKLQLSGM